MSQEDRAWYGHGDCSTMAQFLHQSGSDHCLVAIMRPSDVLVLPPVTRHAVLTVWRKGTPLQQQWCVLGSQDVATRDDIIFSAKMMNRMAASGKRCNATGPDGWSIPWQYLWEIFLKLHPDMKDITDTESRVNLLKGKSLENPTPPRIIGKKRKRQHSRAANLEKARANNPNHQKNK